MSQPEISPLARRLAEENNVDWRDLHGSGAGGKVVERDVLEYLARVMAGEEDIDPTPEPVPEGMESWPEEDIQAFQQEVSASHQNVGLQQIQQELSASDRLSHGPSEPSLEGGPVPPVDEVPPASTHAQPEPDTISEDIFLFDDEEEAAEVPGGDEAAWQASPTPPSEEVEDGLLVAGDESTAWDAGDDELGDGEELWAGAASHEEPDTLPDVFGGGDEGERSGRDSGPALFDDGAGARRDDAAPASDGAGDLEVPPLGDLAGHEGAPASSVDASGPRWPAEADGLEAEDASFGTGGWQVEQPGAQPDELAEGFEPPRESAADAAGEAYAAAQEVSFEAPDEPYGGAGADVGGWEGASEPQPAAFDGASAESAFVESDEGVPAPEPGSVEPPAAPPALSERVAGGMDAASAVPS
ncbi:MAG: E3 binding domain-containing protein, partial [Deinococcales bacterium]